MGRVCVRIIATTSLIAILSSCGGEISLTEYVDNVNAAVDRAHAAAAILTDEGVLDNEDLTPQEVGAGIRMGLEEVRRPLQETIDAIDPPEEVDDLHTLLWSWHADLIAIEAALADRFDETPDTEEGWTSLSSSEEMTAYRASLAEGKQVCIDFQAELDATEARGVFGDSPWLPRELKEVVEIALGCDSFPEDPQSVYRYP
jgi:hypothetical protein